MLCAPKTCSRVRVGCHALLPLRPGDSLLNHSTCTHRLRLQIRYSHTTHQYDSTHPHLRAAAGSSPPSPGNPPAPGSKPQRKPVPVKKPAELEPAERLVRTLGAGMFALPVMEAYYRQGRSLVGFFHEACVCDPRGRHTQRGREVLAGILVLHLWQRVIDFVVRDRQVGGRDTTNGVNAVQVPCPLRRALAAERAGVLLLLPSADVR